VLGTGGVVVDGAGSGGAAMGAALSIGGADGDGVGDATLAPEVWALGVSGGGVLVGAGGADGVFGISDPDGRAGPTTSEG
jgi:hypothetical protein